MESPEIALLAGRVKGFLDVNEKVKLNDLKFHLNCRGTELLLAAGWLLGQEAAVIERRGNFLWIVRNGKGDGGG